MDECCWLNFYALVHIDSVLIILAKNFCRIYNIYYIKKTLNQLTIYHHSARPRRPPLEVAASESAKHTHKF